MKNRIKKRLTLKQAKIMTFIAAIIFCVIETIAIIHRFLNHPDWYLTFYLGVLGFTALLAIIWILLKSIVSRIELDERILSKDFLNKEEFTEILYIPDIHGYEKEITLDIFRKLDCKFFAKLNEDEKIILIVKDNENNVIYSHKMSGYPCLNGSINPKN